MLTDDLPFTRLCLAPPKGHARAAERSGTTTGRRFSLVDVNSAPSSSTRRTAGRRVHSWRGLVGVRLKNPFAEPLFNGYRDALYSVRVSSGILPMSVNCNSTSWRSVWQLHLVSTRRAAQLRRRGA